MTCAKQGLTERGQHWQGEHRPAGEHRPTSRRLIRAPRNARHLELVDLTVMFAVAVGGALADWVFGVVERTRALQFLPDSGLALPCDTLERVDGAWRRHPWHERSVAKKWLQQLSCS